MFRRTIRLFALPFVVLLSMSGALSTHVAAQDEGGFPLGALAAECQPGYGYPFTDCTPWDGLAIAFESADSTFNQTCVTASNGGTTSGCGIDAPFGSTITASIDPRSIPSGYRLEGDATQIFEIPNGPPQGQFAGPVFVLLPEIEASGNGETPPGRFALQANTAFCEPGYLGPFQGCTPWEGVTVTYATPNGAFNESCITGSTGGDTATCSVDVPVITTIIASIDPSTIPAGYVLEGELTQTFEIPNGPPEGQFSGPSFVLLPAVVATPVTGFPLGALTAFCDPGYAYPFVGCSPWDGATISFLATDGSFSDTCTTSSTGGTTSGCGESVPFGSTIFASINPAQIPVGYMMEGDLTQEFEIPNGPPDGEFAGPVFVLLPDDRGDVYFPTAIVDAPKVPLVANAAFCEPGYLGPFVGCTPWNDVVVTFTSADGTFSGSCTTSGSADSRTASCTVNVPVLSTITASIDPATIPDGYALEGDSSETLDIPVGPLEGQLNHPSFVLLPVNAVDVEREFVAPDDDALIVTRLPVTGSGDAVDAGALSPVIVTLVAAAIIGTAGAITARRMQ